jgi:cell division protein FtsL
MLKLIAMQPDIIRPEPNSPLKDFSSIEPSSHGSPQVNHQSMSQYNVPEPGKTVVSKGGSSKKVFLYILLVLVLIGGSCYAVYYWQNTKLNTANNQIASLENQVNNLNNQLSAANKKLSSSSSTTTSTVYPITATTPSTWKTYTSSQYKFSVSYPATWSYTIAPNSTSTPNPFIFEMSFNAPSAVEKANNYISGYSNFAIRAQNLNDSLAYLKSSLINNTTANTTVVDAQVSQTNYTFKGDPAIQLITDATNNTTKAVQYEDNLLIYTNNQTYIYSSSTTNSAPFADSSVATILQSLKIN